MTLTFGLGADDLVLRDSPELEREVGVPFWLKKSLPEQLRKRLKGKKRIAIPSRRN